MADKTADAFKFVLRLPKPLHKRLKQQAKRNNVSLNTEIVNQLEGSEAATAKRMAEALRPALDGAIKEVLAETAFERQIAEIAEEVAKKWQTSRDPEAAAKEPENLENLMQILSERAERERPEAAAKKIKQK